MLNFIRKRSTKPVEEVETWKAPDPALIAALTRNEELEKANAEQYETLQATCATLETLRYRIRRAAYLLQAVDDPALYRQLVQPLLCPPAAEGTYLFAQLKVGEYYQAYEFLLAAHRELAQAINPWVPQEEGIPDTYFVGAHAAFLRQQGVVNAKPALTPAQAEEAGEVKVDETHV